MQLTTVTKHLPEARARYLDLAVAKLAAGVEAGIVPNTQFTGAKDTFNRIVEEGAEAFLAIGPHTKGHHQSDWWLAAYDADAFVRGTHTLPTVLKRAEKAGLTAYAAFIRELLPLRDLLEAAKPLVKKKGELPKVKSAKQIADEADQMTCQCCGRGIFAATGLIAHHGYERPGHGWQTASCFGARHLPWEVSRDALGDLIRKLKLTLKNLLIARDDVAKGHIEVTHTYSVHIKKTDTAFGRYEDRTIRFFSNTFEQCKREFPEAFKMNPHRTFDAFRDHDLMIRDNEIADYKAHITECLRRYEGWKQTHHRAGDKWVEV
jgi:hypothetical protein